MKRLYAPFYFLIVLTLVLGCAQLGLPQAQTFDQKLAVGYATVTAIRTSATTLLAAKKITADDAQHVQDQANNARAGLDIARATAVTDPAAANAKLTAVRTALTALNAYLISKQGGTP